MSGKLAKISKLFPLPLKDEIVSHSVNDNSDLIYLLNTTVFDYITMKWAVMARM